MNRPFKPLWCVLTMLIATPMVAPNDAVAASQTQGMASWYSVESCKREGTSGITASGEPLVDELMTAAKWDVPFDSLWRVTNLANGREIVVRVNDRGPSRRLKGRVIDLSRGAYRRLAGLETGLTRVRIERVK